MSSLDWLLVLIYFFFSLFCGLYFTKRASKSLEEFFLSGRSIPWWLAGTSMVATTFSADTPLYVTGLVRREGIYENWQWWCFVFSGMLGVFVFSRFWKRSGVMTDVELIELRYSGSSARILRAFKAVYFSTIIHTIIKAQVILAMAKILDVMLGWAKWQGIVVSSAVTLLYTIFSGYWGVLTTDFFQFLIAMLGAIILAFMSVSRAGGLSGIRDNLDSGKLDFFPPLTDGDGLLSLAFLTFLGYTGITWWSKYSSDGGGVIVQRVISSKDEREGMKAALFFNIAHYCLRTWPWVFTALASIVIYPLLKDPEIGYPLLAMEILPHGLKGLMLASFFAAFMSTLSTYLNLSSAYFINDFYRPFLRPFSSESHYIRIARFSMLFLSIITGVVTYYVESISGVFTFLIAFGSGTGLVYILRWFWWRINAWSEISAMIASTISTIFIYLYFPGIHYFEKLLFIVLTSTVVWIIVTFITPPVDMERLRLFYSKVKPPLHGWKAVGLHVTTGGDNASIFKDHLLPWLSSSIFIISLTFAIGKLLLGEYNSSLVYTVISVLMFFFFRRAI